MGTKIVCWHKEDRLLWTGIVITVSILNQDGSVTIPKHYVGRWKRLMGLPYHLLSDKEQGSDRHQANKVLSKIK